jgi:hypothetical protein
VTALSVVPVASKNTSNGEIPEARVTLALSVSEPLVLEHAAAAGDELLLTATVALCDTEPPLPVQVMVNVVAVLSAAVDCEPLVARLPDQPPEALQLVALVEDQLRVEVPPLDTLVGLAASVTVGCDGVATDTVVDCAADPPAPVQLKVNFVVLVRAEVAFDPFIASLPLHPPEAVQAVAFVAVHDSIDVAPLATEFGLALMVIVGAGAVTVTVADCPTVPPVPVQVRV